MMTGTVTWTKIDAIVKAMRLHIESAAGIDQRLPQAAGLLVRQTASPAYWHVVAFNQGLTIHSHQHTWFDRMLLLT